MKNNGTAVILGVGMTKFGRHENETVASLGAQAVDEATKDAGLERTDIQAIVFGNVTQGQLEGQYSIPGQVALRQMGITGLPVVNVENACATGATALQAAANLVLSGQVDVALALGVEKMNVPERSKVMGVFESGFDVARRTSVIEELEELGQEKLVPNSRRSIFMDIYAAQAQAHMRMYGSTKEQFAFVAAKNHQVATLNDRAFFREAMSLEDVMGAKLAVEPFTVPMCSPITDGAAAVVVCSPEYAKRKGHASRGISILACELTTGTQRSLTDLESHISRIASNRAYEKAGVSPADVDVVEVHDATSFAEVYQSELLGFFDLGEGGPAAVRGETSLGGRVPINLSGGLVSKGHPIAATGLAQVWELVQQLRGSAGQRQVDGATIALAENGGGYMGGEDAVTAVTILGKGL